MSQTINQLKEEVRKLKSQIFAMQQNSGFYTYIPQTTEGYNQIAQGKVPYFVENRDLSITKPLEPITTMIKGDNLSVLAGLNYVYSGKVDVIYIDPPYNTGKSIYSYNDKRGTSEDSHSAWLSFMEPRLELASNLLINTGVIFVAVGSQEQAHLKLLMDKIFGEDNFITTITVEGVLKNNAKLVSTNNEYWLLYSKDSRALKQENPKWRARKPSAQLLLTKAKEYWEQTFDAAEAQKLLRKYYQTDEAKTVFANEPGLKMYNRVDENGRIYRAGDLSSPGKAGGRYIVYNPDTGKPVKTPARGWANSEKTFNEMVDKGLVIWNDESVPAYKRYLDENTEIVLSDIIKKDDREHPTKLLQKMLGHNKFTFPKNHLTIAEWVDYVLPASRKKDPVNPPLILDFFAGSGTTAQAVAHLNQQDAGNRRCILVTANENSIPFEITHPRLKAMFTGKWASGDVSPLRGQLVWLDVNYASPPVSPPETSWSITGYSQEYMDFINRQKAWLESKNL